jgi:uncharacterized protein (TIGR02996 family)
VDEGQALMRGILAEADEDAPRLVFADWLEENGQPERAQHVRLQCQLAGLPEDDARRAQLKKEAAALEKEHLTDWLGPLDPETCRDPLSKHEHFERGLLHCWYCTVGAFLKKQSQRDVCEWFPRLGVNQLGLSAPSKRAEALAQSPALGWTVELTWIESRAGDDALAALAASPHLGLLSRLDFSHLRCTDAGLEALAKSDGLGNLREFSLRESHWGGRFTPKGALRVLNSDRLPRLVGLKLADGLPHAFDLRQVLRDPGIARLKRLTLWSAAYPAATTALAGNPAAAGLTELYLSSTNVDDAAATALADSPHLAGLKKLQMKNMNNGSERRLTPAVEERLRRRFGSVLQFSYGSLARA